MFTLSETRKTGAFALLLGLVFAVGCGGGDSAADGSASAGAEAPPAAAPVAAAAQESEGERVYGSVCVTCHQAERRRTAGRLPAAGRFSCRRRATPTCPSRSSCPGLTGELTRGGNTYNGMMTPWGSTLSDDDVAAVLTYVRSSFGNAGDAVTARTGGRGPGSDCGSRPHRIRPSGLGIAGE